MFRFFKKKQPAAPVEAPKPAPQPSAPREEWELVPNYLTIDPHDEPIAVVIAAATAAATVPDHELHLRRLAVQNPEAQRVAVIAASVAAATSGKQFVVKSIRRKVSGADATQV
ncbi:hypothetical protein [Lacticaseibacillus baoqingensis]|uniref:hypothetical protein n=1 Tax=Lacticaseibacillus baoqingensis TaxID=2486013 RepID=UPI000F786BCC|nr:hypothetical protein [Lacticaseibacillus baoqingensis]